VVAAKGLTLRGAPADGAAAADAPPRGRNGGDGSGNGGGGGGAAADEAVVPRFLPRQDVDDAWAAARRSRRGGRRLPPAPDVEVGDLLALLDADDRGAAGGGAPRPRRPSWGSRAHGAGAGRLPSEDEQNSVSVLAMVGKWGGRGGAAGWRRGRQAHQLEWGGVGTCREVDWRKG